MTLVLNAMLGSLILGAAYGIAGVTFGLIYRLLKVFHFAFAAIGTGGALIAATIVTALGPSWRSLVIGLVAGMLVTAVLTGGAAMVIYRPLVRRGATLGTTFVSSLGLGLVIEAGFVILAGPQSRSFSLIAFTQQTSIYGLRVSWLNLLALLLVVTVTTGASAFMRATSIGRQAEAVISNPEQAELVGIPSDFITILLSGALGGLSVLAFAVQGLNSSVSTSGGIPLTLFGVLAMLCGGTARIGRTAIAGMLIGLVSGISASIVPGQWASTIVFLVATAIILTRPDGLGYR